VKRNAAAAGGRRYVLRRTGRICFKPAYSKRGTAGKGPYGFNLLSGSASWG